MYRIDPTITDYFPLKMEAEDYALSRLDLRTAGKISAGAETSIAKIRQFTRTNNLSTYSVSLKKTNLDTRNASYSNRTWR